MRITQGTFSFLPDLSDEEIQAQINFCIQNDWAVSIEHTDDPHPRNVYWEMWGLPFFDLESPDAVLEAINACRDEMGASYIRVNGYDRSYGRQTTALSFIVNRPPREKGFRLERTEGTDRRIHYTLRTLTDGPAVMRHEEGNGGRSPGAGSA